MEPTTPTDPPAYSLYSPGQIALASFLGAPLAACWFWSRNDLRLGQPDRARQCLIWGVVGTVAVFLVAAFLPDRFPNLVLPIGYTVGLYHAAKQRHGAIVTQHLDAGGSLGSWWEVVGLGLLSLVLLLVVLFGVVFAISLFFPVGS